MRRRQQSGCLLASPDLHLTPLFVLRSGEVAGLATLNIDFYFCPSGCSPYPDHLSSQHNNLCSLEKGIVFVC